MAKATQIPLDVLAIVGGLLLFMFGVAYVMQRRGNGATAVTHSPAPPTQSRVRRRTVYVLKLVGFGVFSFLMIDLALTFYLSHQTVEQNMASAAHAVEKPADLTLPVTDITFSGGDGLTMTGWYVPSQNGAVVILLHGYGADRTGMAWHAGQLYAAGYGVLLYDERASGESEGEHRSYGWQDPADVAGALRYLQSQSDVDPDRIGVGGCSMGAQIALQSAAIFPDIQAVWADGPSVIRARDVPFSSHPILLLVRPSYYLVDWLMARRLDMALPSAMIDQIDDIAPRPIMLVAGGTPRPLYGAEAIIQERYASYAGENATVWVIEEAFHCDGPVYRPDEYATRMIDFFDTALTAVGK
ncbi:MAG TPA: alpha/beta fold hydrolase [Chloroflexota bacterium]|nr:alpha/beta fold hydrolase [Chloroflexota bacterium]HUM69878.1 alpha/beta fold hydrolase [Chloroflexota bacterium]